MSLQMAIYPGTFDPVTNGHINIIERGYRCFGKLEVAIARNVRKTSLFSLEERIDLLKQCIGEKEDIEIVAFDGLLADYVSRKDNAIILRGIRTVSDFEFEFQMAQANSRMHPNVETLFMMTEGRYSYVSSSIIKEIARFGGPLDGMVPDLVAEALQKKFSEEQ